MYFIDSDIYDYVGTTINENNTKCYYILNNYVIF